MTSLLREEEAKHNSEEKVVLVTEDPQRLSTVETVLWRE